MLRNPKIQLLIRCYSHIQRKPTQGPNLPSSCCPLTFGCCHGYRCQIQPGVVVFSGSVVARVSKPETLLPLVLLDLCVCVRVAEAAVQTGRSPMLRHQHAAVFKLSGLCPSLFLFRSFSLILTRSFCLCGGRQDVRQRVAPGVTTADHQSAASLEPLPA